MTTIHVRYEILDDPGRPHPDSAEDAYPWRVGRPGFRETSAPTEWATHSTRHLRISAKASGPLSATDRFPDELTREISVRVRDAA